MVKEKGNHYICWISTFAYCVFSIGILASLGIVIFTAITINLNPSFISYLPVFIIVGGIFLGLMFWGMLDLTEYYVFEKERIVARSILREKKVVLKEDLQAMYIQWITTIKYFRRSVQKDQYYVLDDASSGTVCSRLRSTTKDLMKIPVASKSTALIQAIWDKEIIVSHFPERT